MPQNPPDSWGQLGRMRAIGGPASTKSVDTPYLAVGFAGASKADGLGGMERPWFRKPSVRYYLANEIYY